jgi:hypothetical protein
MGINGDMTSRSPAVGRMTVLLGLLLAFSGVACGPTRPTWEDEIALYSGRWRGNINGLETVLDVRAERGRPQDGSLVGLKGTGTAMNSGTGESHRLEVFGLVGSFQLRTPYEFGPGGFVLGGNKHIGWFDGNVSPDGRTWTGRWRPTDLTDGAPIFGQVSRSVTLIKE